MSLSMSRAVFEQRAKKQDETRQLAQAANTNEQITRHRVEQIEGVLRRGFLGRLKWLFLGR